MAPRTVVAIISVAAIAIGAFVLFRSVAELSAGPAFVTPAGTPCDPAELLGSSDHQDCAPVEPSGRPLGAALAEFGLLGLIYARLLMPAPAEGGRGYPAA